jgi:hypothetical protein
MPVSPRLVLKIMSRKNLQPSRTWIVMRQAVTTITAALFLAFLPVGQATAAGSDAAAAIAQAKRLIDAKDYSTATILLEDLLPDASAGDKPAILELLRRSYQIMARDAKAAGRDREAAHLLDNLAIIAKAPGAAAPAKPSEERPRIPALTRSPIPATQEPSPEVVNPPKPGPRNVSALGLPQDPSSAPPPESAPVSEPAKMALAQPLALLPKDLDSPASSQSGPGGTPSAPPPPQSQADPGRAPADPLGPPASPAAVAAASGASSIAARDALAQPPREPNPATDQTMLEEGDRLFSARKYQDAGRCYAALARQNRLPALRKQHWAYCRMVDVARKINLRPRSNRDWDEIEAEILNIQRLGPNIWYGEYLRNKVAEVRRNGRRPPAKSDNLVVRGTSPDEGPSQPEDQPRRFPRLFGNSRADASSQASPAPAATRVAPAGEIPLNLPGGRAQSQATPVLDVDQENDRPSTGNGPVPRSRPAQDAAVHLAAGDSTKVAWQVLETANFRIYHCDDARLALAAGQAAETVRKAQAKRWASPAAQKPWTPHCEIYLYPSGKAFASETKQPEESPGFSTMESNGSRVVARRVNLRADHPQVVAAILPHEVTHVVLADIFTNQQIPRWADEGLAVLAEPKTEQQIRAAELQEPLEAGRLFDLGKLVAMDYPDPKDWSLYYAQSVSLTRFLVEQGPPEQFIQFVQSCQRDGIDNALRDTYRITGLGDLQSRWALYAREQVGPVRSASRAPRAQPADTEVK